MAIDLLETYEPSEVEEYMSGPQLNYFSKKLIKLRQELSRQAETKRGELKDTSLRTADVFDSASHQEEVALDIKGIGRQTRQIDLIDRALLRIKKGEYGYCEITGEEIGIRRLKAQPLATLCIEVQEMLERQERIQALHQPVY